MALPATLLYQAVAGAAGVETVAHFALATGAALMSRAAFDFRTARWIAGVGCASAGALAAIFLLQGASELLQNAALTRLVYQQLGQRLEGWLVDLFLLWCVAVWLSDSRGKTKAWGCVALSIAVCVEVYANGLSYAGTSLNTEAPALKAVMLLPFTWLLVESRKTARSPIAFRPTASALP